MFSGDYMVIGSHVSYSKKSGLYGCALEEISYGGNAFMFYTGAPQNTIRSSIDLDLVNSGKELILKNKMSVIIHAPYIINLANDRDLNKYRFSIDFLRSEIHRCEVFGVDKLVLHPGSHVGLGIDRGIDNIINALNVILKDSNTFICLETMAGKGSEIGSNFYELKRIIDGVKYKDKILICLDTCHMWDSGIDVRDFDLVLDSFDSIIGIDKIGCIHFNDSLNDLGSHKDRHANIGYGLIGFDNLMNIIYNKRVSNIPFILETPYIDGHAPYGYEIGMILDRKFSLYKR